MKFHNKLIFNRFELIEVVDKNTILSHIQDIQPENRTKEKKKINKNKFIVINGINCSVIFCTVKTVLV